MTRGPLPKKAIVAAQERAALRGTVLDARELGESHYDLILFNCGCTVFVRVKRIRTHVTEPGEIEAMFREDVIQVRRVPKTPVVSREIWVLSPWGCWQYFQVIDDRIVEIRRDGAPVMPAVPDAGAKPVPAETPVVPDVLGTGMEQAPAGTPPAPAGAGIQSSSPTVVPG
jgi:hypothetical protein